MPGRPACLKISPFRWCYNSPRFTVALNLTLAMVMKDKKNSSELNLSAPLVSVVVTSYNYGRFVRQALESVPRRTIPIGSAWWWMTAPATIQLK